jgi:hypothetical protein
MTRPYPLIDPAFRAKRNREARLADRRKSASPEYLRLRAIDKRVFKVREQINLHMEKVEKLERELLRLLAERPGVSARWVAIRNGYLKGKEERAA